MQHEQSRMTCPSHRGQQDRVESPGAGCLCYNGQGAQTASGSFSPRVAPRPERINTSILHARAGTLFLVPIYRDGEPLGVGYVHCQLSTFGICFTKLERDAISQHLDFNTVVKQMGVKEWLITIFPPPLTHVVAHPFARCLAICFPLL